MKFFGGHHTQVFESTAHPVYNPLSLGVLADLIDLVDQVIHGENLGRPSNAKPFSKEQGPLRVVWPRRNAVLCIADSPKISA